MAALTSITGLQNLTNIREFHADYNSLTSIDFSGLSSLTLIDISDNEVPGDSTHSLTSVNLSGCTSLETLRIDDSDFSAGFPDLSDCTSLQWIDADDSYLSGSVDISNAPALRGFDFSQNSDVTEIIISKDLSILEELCSALKSKLVLMNWSNEGYFILKTKLSSS
jgi:Leucine-rich repeat (LRR) protein